jgi:fumarate hydratase, class II
LKPRIETDAFGSIEIPEGALWGPQTARSLQFFKIGEQRMPLEVIRALGAIKEVAATVNHELELLEPARARAISEAAHQVSTGLHDEQFPLSVWQTGSGTQSNMNVNEVIATLASSFIGMEPGLSPTIHPNDEVNLGQSSNDCFPSAMHIAVLLENRTRLVPALESLCSAMAAKSRQFKDLIKVGRTHLQDATPLTLGQEFGGYEAQLQICQSSLAFATDALHYLAIGGTAVGTGMNTHPEFAKRAIQQLSVKLDLPLKQANNLFAAMAGHEPLVAFHSSIRLIAITLTKIANDLRLMASGPRAGLGELLIPQNEAGSSIMPSKVNPTQIEALTMVCLQVQGFDLSIGMAAASGQLELNAYKPLIVFNVLTSIRILSDAINSFTQHCLRDLTANEGQLARGVQHSLMLVTALVPHIGYDNAARCAKYASEHEISLRDAALKLDLVSASNFDLWVDPRKMISNNS